MVTGEFPAQRPVTRSFDVFFDLRLNKLLSKQPWGWWFETLSWSLWRHCNAVFLWCVSSRFYWYRDNVIKWKHCPHYWPFLRRIHRSSVNSPHRGQWRDILMFSLICAWISGWVNNREAGQLRRHRAHYNVTAMDYGIYFTAFWVKQNINVVPEKQSRKNMNKWIAWIRKDLDYNPNMQQLCAYFMGNIVHWPGLHITILSLLCYVPRVSEFACLQTALCNYLGLFGASRCRKQVKKRRGTLEYSLERICLALTWVVYDLETLSTSLALCERNPPVTGGFTSPQRPQFAKRWCFHEQAV